MARIRVLVVDDSVVIRKLVSDLLAQDPDIEVVGTAVNGRAGLQKIALLKPDLVTMDVEMPELNGIETVRSLRQSGSRIPVIMFSTLTERGAEATLDALAAGASDYVPKPANVGSVGRSMEQVREALIPRIKSLVPRRGASTSAFVGQAPVSAPTPVPLRTPVVRPVGSSDPARSASPPATSTSRWSATASDSSPDSPRTRPRTSAARRSTCSSAAPPAPSVARCSV